MASKRGGRPRGPGRAPPPMEMDNLDEDGREMHAPRESPEAAGPIPMGASALAVPRAAERLPSSCPIADPEDDDLFKSMEWLRSPLASLGGGGRTEILEDPWDSEPQLRDRESLNEGGWMVNRGAQRWKPPGSIEEDPWPDLSLNTSVYLSDDLNRPWAPGSPDELEEVVIEEATPLLENQPEVFVRGDEARQASVSTAMPHFGTQPTTSSGNESVAATIAMLKELLRQERLASRSYSQLLDSIFRTLLEILEMLESMTVESSSPGIQNLKLAKKRRIIEEQLYKLPPIEWNRLYCILFVLQYHLQQAATKWQSEDDSSLLQQIEEVTKTMAYFVDHMRIDIEPVLSFQRDISNSIWEMNCLYEVKRRSVNEGLPDLLDTLALDLMQLANSLLSSAIEQWLLIRPCPFPKQNLLTSILESSASDKHSESSMFGEGEASIKGYDSESYLQDYVQGLKGLKVVQMALTEVLLEEHRRDHLANEAAQSHFESGLASDYVQGEDNHMDLKAEGDPFTSIPTSNIPEAAVGIGEVTEVLQEAIHMIGELLEGKDVKDEGGKSRNLRLKKIFKFPEEIKADTMFLTHYLDAEKFKGIADDDSISGINSLVRLNNVLVHLRWAVESIGGQLEEGEVPQDDDSASYVRFDSLPFADDNLMSMESYRSLPGERFISKGRMRILLPSGDDSRRHRTSADSNRRNLVFDGHGITSLLNKFQRKLQRIGIISSRIGDIPGDRRSQYGGEGFQHEKMAKVAKNISEGRSEFWTKSLKDKQAFEDRLRSSYGKGKFSSAGRTLAIDNLLFEKEKAALQALADSQDKGMLENLDKVAFSLKGRGMGYWRKLPRSLRSFPKPPRGGKVDPLDESIMSTKKTRIPREKLRAKNFQLFTIGLYPLLYAIDVLSDAFVALGHFSKSNYLYFSLTILFILGPMVAEVTSKIALKLYGSEKTLPWKTVLNMESIRLLPRSWKSFNYGLNSRMEFDDDLKTFYTELNRLRMKEGGLLEPLAGFKGQEISRAGFDARLIQSHFYAMMITNEKLLFNWKMADCLNESAPQLLLQLVIAVVQFIEGKWIDPGSLFGIVSSLASLSWTMHLCHYYMHFDGLKNNFQMIDRVSDFLAHFFIVSARFAAISFVAALHPKSFFIVSAIYLTARCVYLIFFSSISWAYRMITENRTTFLWPLHRLYITPFILRLWRCDAGDDVIYHLETFILAFSWPYFVDKDHPMGHLRWTVPAAILLTNFILLPILLKFNSSRHEPSRFCREDDPFWLGKYLGRKEGINMPQTASKSFQIRRRNT